MSLETPDEFITLEPGDVGMAETPAFPDCETRRSKLYFLENKRF